LRTGDFGCLTFCSSPRRRTPGAETNIWETADLVVEVVSEDDRSRDLETKRFEYAQAGIPEYWIIDPKKSEVIVLTLAGQRYDEHGIFTTGQRATSSLLNGFEVEVDQVFSAK